ncbi:MAG: hypothetical protein ABFD54_00185 [Armatimonadota bacterium]|nr:hypothetical protein [bacterium]
MFQKASFSKLRGPGRIATAALGLVLILSVSALAQPANPSGSIANFFHSIVGEWIGTCEQSTNGEKAENKYFHFVVTQVNSNSYNSKFEYFRFDDAKGAPIPIGSDSVITTIKPDGKAETKLDGKGIVLVENKPKNQTHSLVEVLSNVPGGLQGKGTGKVSVSGMPLGLGKNGKVNSSQTAWALNNGILTINQQINVGFRALFFTKKFNMQAKYTAQRGSDVASIIKAPTKVSAKPGSKLSRQM